MVLPNQESRVLLAVLAHPDDESFGMGGTLARYAYEGVEVHLICATRGEAGMMDAEYMDGFSSIAERREHELQCAAEALGLAGLHILDYRDSGMPGTPENEHPLALFNAPVDEVAGKIAHFIRLLRPQVVITFDPIGGYRHPDHIAVHEATVRAFEAAGDPSQFPGDLPAYRPQRLYFHTLSRTFLRIAVRLMPLFGKDPRHWGRNGDIDLTRLADVHFPTHAQIDFKSVQDRKQAAAGCHASQGGSAMVRGLMGWVLRLAGGTETFMQAYPPPEPGLRIRDLFAGVSIEPQPETAGR